MNPPQVAFESASEAKNRDLKDFDEAVGERVAKPQKCAKRGDFKPCGADEESRTMADKESAYYVYLLRCSDDSLYCGIARNPELRLEAHNSGKGAKYTRSRRPCRLVLREGPLERGDALRREAEIKGLSRADKEELVCSDELVPGIQEETKVKD